MAVFTTREGLDTEQALRIHSKGQYKPFSRDTLLLSVYDSLRHRKTALEDATALTNTILGRLYTQVEQATLERDTVVEVTAAVLSRFDAAAATHYRAFHP